jgi:hypothetical protein
VSCLRWRLAALAGDTVALIDRVFVVKGYRRRRVARTMMLNALVDVFEAVSKPGWGGLAAPPAIGWVCVVLPQDERLRGLYDLLVGMGFAPRRQFPADPTGQWEEAGVAPAAPRVFVEVALALAAVMPLLQKAQADREGMRPRVPE